MRHTRRELLGIAAASTGLIAGCTGADTAAQETTTARDTTEDETMATTQTATERTEQETGGYTVEVRTNDEHGVILTDADGMTLYLFTEDSEGESVCYDDCASAWPPLTVDGPLSIPEGLPGTFDTIERDDGSTQVTYEGMPLYYFQSDAEPGDVTGQGVNDVWFVVNPTCGEGLTTAGTTTAAETTESDGDGDDSGDSGDDGMY